MKEIDVDVLDMLDEQIKNSRNLIKEGLSKASGAREYKISNFDVTDKKNGDWRHHTGVNIVSKNQKDYFIGFSGLNIDASSGNIHSSIGRIQLFIGNGSPNQRHVVDKEVWFKINYPCTTDPKLEIGRYDDRKILNTGYRIFGNRKSGDILLDKNNIEKFCELIVNFIEEYEKNMVITKNND